MSRPETIGYGRAEPASRTWWRRARADWAARTDGAARFVGQVIGLLGGVRQVGFAAALTMLAGGLGECLTVRALGEGGAGWMAVGGLLFGLVVPVPTRQR